MFRLNRFVKVTAIALALISLASVAAFAEYDQDKVVQVMRENIGLMGAIGTAASEEEWVVAAQNLFAIAEGMLEIMKYDPPRGDKADWDATMQSFVDAAYVGIGACGVRDAEALQESITALQGLNKQGHRAHK